MTDASNQLSEFKNLVNMTSSQLEHWLKTDESKQVGAKEGNNESTGHRSGRKILTILSKSKSDLNDNDFDHMKRVVAYIKRHLAQKPTKESIESSRWRYSLMNWGHDPLKQ